MINKLLKKNKKGFLLRTWVMGFIIFSAVFALFYLMVEEQADIYDDSGLVDSDYSDHYDKFEETREDVDSMFETARDPEGFSLISSAVAVFKATKGVITATCQSVFTVKDLGVDFMEDFGVPRSIAAVIFPLLSALLIIALVFIAISSVSGGNKI